MGRFARPRTAVSLILALLSGVALAFGQSKPAPQTKATTGAKTPAAKIPSTSAVEEAREANLRAYTELLRSDLRAQKTAVIAEVMQFSEAEDAKFWPVYRAYEADLQKLNDDRIALINEYVANYETLTDDVADRLALRALDLESRRQTLKTSYYTRLKGALSPKTAARVIQVENQILLLLDLQIAASLPIVQSPSSSR